MDNKTLYYYIPEIMNKISHLPQRQQERIQEIRLRAEQFVVLELDGGNDRIRLDMKVSSREIEEYIRRFCEYSLHSCMSQLKDGFVTLKGGHRVGICGTAVLRNGVVESVRNISSINIRIAKQYIGCSDRLYEQLCGDRSAFRGLLIIGPPMSAKTTVMRDLVRNISICQKVAVIDERGEIAAGQEGGFDLGANTDVLSFFPKREGFLTALRALSPEYIACDEIGFDYDAIHSCVNSGVRVLLTAHCSSFDELQRSSNLTALMKTGGISHVALLDSGYRIGQLKEFRQVYVGGEEVEYIVGGANHIVRSRIRVV